MIQEIKRAKRFASYLVKSQSDRWLHSPFIFDLYTEVFLDSKHYYAFELIEDHRELLLNNNQKITITDFGAGSKKFKGNQRRVKDIAITALKSSKQCQQLFRLVNHLQPSSILEFGTSLGITSSYLASACKRAQVVSFEGCPEHAKIASDLWRKLNLTNIELIKGNLDKTLPEHLESTPMVDFVFFDANHRYEPTIRYFQQCLQLSHSKSVFVFDDIHWSDEMFQAWNEIIQNPKVTASVDLFHFGIVFFDTSLSKQHFILR